MVWNPGRVIHKFFENLCCPAGRLWLPDRHAGCERGAGGPNAGNPRRPLDRKETYRKDDLRDLGGIPPGFSSVGPAAVVI